MEALGVEDVEIYVLHLQNIIHKYIATHLILELCMAEEHWTVTGLEGKW